jgi:hypothetical protein
VIMACPHAKGLRTATRQVWKLPPEERLGDTSPEWFLVLLDSWDVEEVAALALIMWRAWSVRNKVTIAGEALSIDNSVDFLMSLANQLLMVNGHQSDGANAVRGRVREPTGWTPPARDAIKINVDGAFIQRTGAGAVGVIAQSHEGQPHIMA